MDILKPELHALAKLSYMIPTAGQNAVTLYYVKMNIIAFLVNCAFRSFCNWVSSLSERTLYKNNPFKYALDEMQAAVDQAH